MTVRTPGNRCLVPGCTNPVDPNDHDNVLLEVTGYERLRDQGGQNHVIAKTRTGRATCGEHGSRIRHGLAPDQGTLA